jgi:hypothetical protein
LNDTGALQTPFHDHLDFLSEIVRDWPGALYREFGDRPLQDKRRLGTIWGNLERVGSDFPTDTEATIAKRRGISH